MTGFPHSIIGDNFPHGTILNYPKRSEAIITQRGGDDLNEVYDGQRKNQ